LNDLFNLFKSLPKLILRCTQQYCKCTIFEEQFQHSYYQFSNWIVWKNPTNTIYMLQGAHELHRFVKKVIILVNKKVFTTTIQFVKKSHEVKMWFVFVMLNSWGTQLGQFDLVVFLNQETPSLFLVYTATKKNAKY
jgi:hypothetical protein